MKRKTTVLILVGVALLAAVLYLFLRPPQRLVLTGIVTTDAVIVSPEIQGRVQRMLVREGDVVTNGQLLAVLQPQEWQAEVAFYASAFEQSAAQVAQAEADLQFQEGQTSNQIRQAEATLSATQAQVLQAQADLENARLTFQRQANLYHRGIEPPQTFDQARTARDAAQAHVQALEKQVDAARAAVAMAKSNRDLVTARRAALEASLSQRAAAKAQNQKARIRLGYTEVHAPTAGIVDTRVALQGEVVNPGQAIVTLINPDDLWVRADIEETYVSRLQLGQQFKVRLASGVEKVGTVFFRGVDAEYATQRDVSRTKRDIKTFEIRLRCDNRDWSMAVGMTAYVYL